MDLAQASASTVIFVLRASWWRPWHSVVKADVLLLAIVSQPLKSCLYNRILKYGEGPGLHLSKLLPNVREILGSTRHAGTCLPANKDPHYRPTCRR